MRTLRPWGWALAAALLASPAHAAALTRAQAVAALAQDDAATRMAGVLRLAEIGAPADADRLLPRLSDNDPRIRDSATAAIWQIWSRSGDTTIDRLYARGIAQMNASDLNGALATFSEIVRRKPAFPEGWNKRATIYFLLGEHEKSLQDCDEVIKRNRHHFGALSGAGQIHMQLGHARQALEFFRRAVEVNPHLEGPAQLIPQLEQHLRDVERNTA